MTTTEQVGQQARPNGEARNPLTNLVEWYFPKGMGFSPKRLADRLLEDARFAAGGGQLYVYRDGAYRANGDSYVRSCSTKILGERWVRRCADETTAFLLWSSPDIWDRPPPGIVNVRNGLLDVTTGELKPHTPDFLSPIQIGAAYEPGARSELVESFVEAVFPGDAAGLAYELPGYLMVPDTSLERAIMLLGDGSNGKSTYLTMLEAFLGGTANVSAVRLQSLDSNRFASAGLYGKLANIVADLDVEAVKSSGTFKQIVSGDTISAERKYGTPFSFRPYARLLFSANEPPPSHDTTYAYFRRWTVVPFGAKFAGKSKDKELKAKLCRPAELTALLNLAIEGLARLRTRGDLAEPASLVAASRDFRAAVDSAAAFVNEECIPGPDYRVGQKQLYEAYKAWCERVTRSPVSARKFNERVGSLLPDPSAPIIMTNGYPHWQGIGLRADIDDQVRVASCAKCGTRSYVVRGVCKKCAG